ncbi:hypothetical protein MY10362_003119 [Beauveria mimosiformis]
MPHDQFRPKLVTEDYLRAGDNVEVKRPCLFSLTAKAEIPVDNSLFANPYAITNIGWSSDSQEYYFVFNERGHQHFRLLEINLGGAVKPLAEEESKTFVDYHQKIYFKLLPASKEFLWASERDDWNHIYLSEVKGGWRSVERFNAPGRDGKTQIYGTLVYPKDFDETKKYPVIEYIYAGPQDFYTAKTFPVSSDFRTLADKGYIVIRADGMGTNWRSKPFHDVCYKNTRDAGFPDRIAWVRAAAAASRPFMDLTRVGCYGYSAGGQNAALALAHVENRLELAHFPTMINRVVKETFGIKRVLSRPKFHHLARAHDHDAMVVDNGSQALRNAFCYRILWSRVSSTAGAGRGSGARLILREEGIGNETVHDDHGNDSEDGADEESGDDAKVVHVDEQDNTRAQTARRDEGRKR